MFWALIYYTVFTVIGLHALVHFTREIGYTRALGLALAGPVCIPVLLILAFPKLYHADISALAGRYRDTITIAKHSAVSKVLGGLRIIK